jgi:hypothetical protein
VTLRAVLLAAALAAAGGCAMESPYVPPPMTGEGTPLHPPEEAWARLLKVAVRADGRVDFNAVLANHKDLDTYVAWIYERSPERWPELYRTRAQVVAFHLNAYNALAIYNLLTAGVPGSLGVMERKRLLETRKLLVGGQPLTMTEYREQIRALGEPRAHFALSRVLGGDPRLSREPYRAVVLDGQLDRAARAFFAEPRNLRVDGEHRRIELSPLLRDYAPDFPGGARSLVQYADAFTDTPLPQGYAVEFTDFNWDVWRTGPIEGSP